MLGSTEADRDRKCPRVVLKQGCRHRKTITIGGLIGKGFEKMAFKWDLQRDMQEKKSGAGNVTGGCIIPRRGTGARKTSGTGARKTSGKHLKYA